MKESCESCKFWDSANAVQFKTSDGVVAPCRRYPAGPMLEHFNAPLVRPEVVASKLRPMMKSVDWCGEYVQLIEQKLVEKLEASGFKNMNDVFELSMMVC